MAKGRKRKKNKERKKQRERNQFVLLIPILLVIVIGGTIGGTLVTITSSRRQKRCAETKAKGIASDESIVALEEFLVNLRKKKGQDRQYMKVNLSILVDNEEKKRRSDEEYLLLFGIASLTCCAKRKPVTF